MAVLNTPLVRCSLMQLKLLVLIIIFSGSAQGCGEYFYGRIAYGLMTNNLTIPGHKGNHEAYDAATLDLGYKWRMSNQWYWDIQFQHTSQYFAGTPFNNTPELTSEQISIGLEYRIY